ncbi:hypothetical protein J6590_051624 [Homalodisca vitripennis]|nr:hypothetical protein J6590_051624 [Homalodisca vitripennis]
MGWLSWERYRCITDCDLYPDECISEVLDQQAFMTSTILYNTFPDSILKQALQNLDLPLSGLRTSPLGRLRNLKTVTRIRDIHRYQTLGRGKYRVGRQNDSPQTLFVSRAFYNADEFLALDRETAKLVD